MSETVKQTMSRFREYLGIQSKISMQRYCNMCIPCVCYSATLLAFLVELLKSSVAMQEQMLGGKGFLVIGYLLEKVSKKALTMTSFC